MDKPISRQAHGLADYAYAPLMAAAPEAFGFEDEPAATALCRAVGGGVLASTLATRAEWGAFRVLPFKAHLALDFATGLALIGAPWLFGFSRNERARGVFLAMGLTSVLAASLTRPEEMPADLGA